jgi:transglutaminase-like putative cysteine protease
MIQLRYSYKTKISFSENIYFHHLLLRCTPTNFDSQQVKEKRISILPHGQLNFGTDHFGNLVNSVFIAEAHHFFEFESSGVVQLTNYRIEETLNRLYLYPSKFTQTSFAIERLFEKTKLSSQFSIQEQVTLLSEKIQQALTYVSGITTVQTTATQALEMGKGVCQDFTHLLITLCRRAGIPARYVNGFMQGEGFTHAWIEFYDAGFWYGFDPTHDRLIDTGYIKVAHGRDYDDCVIDRGVFKGLAQQKLEVFLKVEQQQQ